MLASHQAARAASPPEAYHTNPRNSLPRLGPLLTTSNLQPLFSFFLFFFLLSASSMTSVVE